MSCQHISDSSHNKIAMQNFKGTQKFNYQGYTGAEIAKELSLYSSTCYKIIAGKISLVENSPSHDDSVEIVSLDDDHTESQLKQVPMNSAKALPAVDESKIIKPELPAEDSKSQISDHSASKAPVLNERKVLNQLSNTVRLYFNGIRINVIVNFLVPLKFCIAILL